MSGHIHLVLGGARSGKSTHAQELAAKTGGDVVYAATCATAGLDPEMAERIAEHVKSRPAHWKTIENRFDLEEIIREAAGGALLLDCLTLWLAYRQGEGKDEGGILAELEAALNTTRREGVTLFIVSNELGMGLVPMGADSRAFRDLCGRANQLAARLADRVEFMVAGLPLKLK